MIGATTVMDGGERNKRLHSAWGLGASNFACHCEESQRRSNPGAEEEAMRLLRYARNNNKRPVGLSESKPHLDYSPSRSLP